MPRFPWLLRTKFRRRLLFGGTLLLGLAWFAPAIVGHSGLRNTLARQVLSDLRGSVHVGKASLGWLSPVNLEDVEVRDPQGRLLLAVGRIESRRSLLGILLDRDRPGVIRFERPALDVVFAGDGSNLEDTLAAYLTDDGSDPTPGPELTVEVVEGRATLHDQDTGRQTAVEAITATVHVPPEPGVLPRVEAKARVENGSIEALYSDSHVSLTADGVPLAVVAPILRRVEKATRLDGVLSARLDVTREGQRTAVQGLVAVRGLDLTTPLLADRLRLDRLDVPIHFSLEGDEMQVEQTGLRCDLGSASLKGTFDTKGDLAALLKRPGCEATVNLELDRAAALLPNTLRLRSDTTLNAGRLTVRLTSVSGRNSVAWTGLVRVTDLEGNTAGRTVVWREPLAVDFRARVVDGLPVFDRLQGSASFLRLEGRGSAEALTATADLDLDKLAAELSQFADLTGLRLVGTVNARLQMERRDEMRLDVAATLRGLDLAAGGLHLSAGGEAEVHVRQTFGAVLCDNLHLRLQNVRCDAPGLWVREPSLEVRATGRLDAAKGALDLSDVEIAAQAVNASLPRLLLGPDGMSGTLEVRGNAGRVWSWLQDPSQPGGTPLRGTLAGKFDLKQNSAGLGIDADLTIDGLVYGPPASPYWSEPRAHLVSQLQYHSAADRMTFERLRLEGTGLTCDVRGAIDRLSSTQNLSLDGRLDSDLQKLEPMLRSYLGNTLRVAGRDSRPFRLAGSLSAPEGLAAWTGEASAGWQRLELFGAVCGPADLRLTLAKGLVQLQPVDCVVSEGRLHLEPAVQLSPSPAEVYLGRGTRIDRARISPAMSESLLKYAIPALAGVTEAEGRLSMALDGGRLPLSDLARGSASGKLMIHSVRIGACPLVRELAVLLNGRAETSLRQESVVTFRMEQGRVYHEGMELVFPELTVRTSGWVGLDGSLALVAEFPVPPKWVGSSTVGQALAGRIIRLPIRGTLDSPKLDPNALREASAQIVRETTKGLLEKKVEHGLKKLLRDRK